MNPNAISFAGSQINLVGRPENPLVPVKTLCEILDLNYSGQFSQLKAHSYLGQLLQINATVGADGKRRQMVCLPLLNVPDWLNGIRSREGKAESEELRMRLLRFFNDERSAMIGRQAALVDQLRTAARAGEQIRQLDGEIRECQLRLRALRERRRRLMEATAAPAGLLEDGR